MKTYSYLVFLLVFICMGCSSDKKSADCSERICTDVYISIPLL